MLDFWTGIIIYAIAILIAAAYLFVSKCTDNNFIKDNKEGDDE